MTDLIEGFAIELLSLIGLVIGLIVGSAILFLIFRDKFELGSNLDEPHKGKWIIYRKAENGKIIFDIEMVGTIGFLVLIFAIIFTHQVFFS